MPYSHHSHSGQFCKHASGTLQQVVLEAIKQGFEVFGLTEHVPRYRVQDLYPEEERLPVDSLSSQFDAFLTEAHRLKALYADQITLLVGLETEYITTDDLDRLEALLVRHSTSVEYIVGSIHHVNGIPIDFDLATFHKALDSVSPGHIPSDPLANPSRINTYLCLYFDAQYDLLRRFRPELIGHLDLCRLYLPALRFADYPDAWEKLERNIRFAIGYGALFELNAAALRKGWSSSYPGDDVVKVIQQHSGRFALSDDSHGPHAVGLNYNKMAEYLRNASIQELWVLVHSDAPNDAGRFISAQRVVGAWWEHPFWTQYPHPSS